MGRSLALFFSYIFDQCNFPSRGPEIAKDKLLWVATKKAINNLLRARWAQQGGAMGSLESRIGHGVSACGDHCVDHAVSALLTCKAVLKALGCPWGALAGIPRGKRNSAVFICNSARDEAKDCARNDCVYWMHSFVDKRRKENRISSTLLNSQWWWDSGSPCSHTGHQ